MRVAPASRRHLGCFCWLESISSIKRAILGFEKNHKSLKQTPGKTPKIANWAICIHLRIHLLSKLRLNIHRLTSVDKCHGPWAHPQPSLSRGTNADIGIYKVPLSPILVTNDDVRTTKSSNNTKTECTKLHQESKIEKYRFVVYQYDRCKKIHQGPTPIRFQGTRTPR